MDAYEEAVLNCLAANGETFVSPEPDVGDGWSRPDFVAIRPPKRTVYVVEVTTSGNATGLIAKVNDRERRWLGPLRTRLNTLGVADESWSYVVLVFVRSDQLDWLKGKISDMTSVRVLSVEDAFAHWEWCDSVWTPSFSFETDEIKRRAK
jgi:hypothetical protein